MARATGISVNMWLGTAQTIHGNWPCQTWTLVQVNCGTMNLRRIPQMTSVSYLNTRKQISWKFGGHFRRNIKNETFLYSVPFISDFENCIFSCTTLHAWVALKTQYLFVVGAKAFPANQYFKYECLPCAFQLFHIFPVVYDNSTPSLLFSPYGFHVTHYDIAIK